MPISLIVSLALTLIYALLAFNREVFENVYLKTTKIDIVGALAITSWVYYYIEGFNAIAAIVSSVIVLCVIVLAQLSLYYTKSKQEKMKNSNNDINLNAYVNNNEEIKAVSSTAISFIGKRGTIKGRINGNYYLGLINMGSEESPSMQDILLYNEDGFQKGDTYEIVGFEGTNIMAKKA